MLLHLCSSFDFSDAFQVPPNLRKSGTVLWRIFGISAKSGMVGKQWNRRPSRIFPTENRALPLIFFLPFHWPRAQHVTGNATNSILLMRNWHYALVWEMADRLPEQAESDLTCLVDQKNGDRMIKQLLNSVIANYRDLSVSCRSIYLLQPSGSANNRPIRLTQCCTQFRPLGVKVLCVFHLHDNIAFTFKWYGNT